jgi:multicomponent K+:H+ antiporter subunit D
LQHLPVVPIVAPLLAGALCLLILDRSRARIVLALLSLMVQICAAATLLYLTTDAMPAIWTEGVGTYSIGDWPAPFGIVLVIDRLSAIMLLLTSLVGSAALVYSLAHWDRVAPGFHSLFQFLLMGINGAFLTGDLFNFFVFFEVLLASSYGLLLHGSGSVRVKSGVHYIVVNLTASLLFLVGVSMIYGMTGTLSMAQLPQLVARLDPDDRAIFQSGAAILGVAFLVKAGIWPLNFWLPTAYAASSAPVAAVFSLMTKVGVYAVLRVGTLLASGDARSSFIDIGLFYGGIATIAYAIIGMLSAQQLGRLIAYSVIGSSGMLFMTLGLGIEALTAPALYYLLSSVLATGAFFLLNGMTDRARMLSVSTPADIAPLPDVTYQGFGVRESPDPHSVEDEIGIAVPAAMAFLGLAFVCCVLLVAGLPPLSGFIGKLAILHVLVTTGGDGGMSWNVWALIIAVLAMGLAAVIALSRIGMRLFWTVTGRTTPRLRLIEAGPVAFLLALCIGLTIGGRPIMTYLDSAARSLHSPETYIRVVMSAQTRGDAGQAQEAAP